MNDTITCPKCRHKIALSESLIQPALDEAKKAYEISFTRLQKEVEERENIARDKVLRVEQQVQDALAKEREKIKNEEVAKIKSSFSNQLERKTQELANLQDALEENTTKLADAQKAQLALMKKERALEDEKREVLLTVEKRVQEELAGVSARAKLEAEETLNLRVKEKELTISAMQAKIEDLMKRSSQGSTQIQGEAQEIVLEDTLRQAFPEDTITPVPKGVSGGDITHDVFHDRAPCGTILWEVKRTKTFSAGWLTKLRNDAREAKADIPLLVTHALPEGVLNFTLMDGVWVTSVACAVPVAMILRQSLIDVYRARAAQDGQETKTQLVYTYLTGPRFKQRIEAIVEAFTSMQADLAKEKTLITRQWAKRNEQITRVMQSSAGMYGDLEGIAGKSLKEIDGLSLSVKELQ